MDTASARLLRYIIHPCLAITPFLVLVVFKDFSYSPYVAARSLAFRFLTEAMFVAWVLLAIKEARFRPRKNPFFISFAVFLVIQLIAALCGEDTAKSFWGTMLRMEGLVTYLHLFAYILVLSSAFKTRESWKLHLNLHICAGSIFAVLCLIEWFVAQEGYRITSLLGNPIFAATYSYFIIFIAGMLLVQKTTGAVFEKFFRVVYVCNITAHLLIIFLTGTRATLLSLVVALVVMAVLALWLLRTNRRIRQVAIPGLALLAVCGLTLIAFREASFIKKTPILARIAAGTPGSSAANIRLASWRAAFEGAKERPLRGWGAENFQLVMSKFFDPALFDHGQWFDRAHNVFLDWLVAGGIAGLLSFLFLLGSHFRNIWRGAHGLPQELKIIMTGMLAGYLVQEFFAFDNIMSLILWGTMAAFVLSTTREPQKQTNLKEVHDQKWLKTTTIYLLCTVPLIFAVNYKPLRLHSTISATQQYRPPENPDKTLELFKKLLASKSFAQAEIVEEFFNFVTERIPWNNFSPQQRAAYFSLLLRELDAEIARNPSDPRVLWFAARARIEIGDFARAVTYMREAKILAPRMPIIFSTLARAYFLGNDYASTEKELESLYLMAPENKGARAAYSQILLLNGKKAQAEAILLIKK